MSRLLSSKGPHSWFMRGLTPVIRSWAQASRTTSEMAVDSSCVQASCAAVKLPSHGHCHSNCYLCGCCHHCSLLLRSSYYRLIYHSWKNGTRPNVVTLREATQGRLSQSACWMSWASCFYSWKKGVWMNHGNLASWSPSFGSSSVICLGKSQLLVGPVTALHLVAGVPVTLPPGKVLLLWQRQK